VNPQDPPPYPVQPGPQPPYPQFSKDSSPQYPQHPSFPPYPQDSSPQYPAPHPAQYPPTQSYPAAQSYPAYPAEAPPQYPAYPPPYPAAAQHHPGHGYPGPQGYSQVAHQPPGKRTEFGWASIIVASIALVTCWVPYFNMVNVAAAIVLVLAGWLGRHERSRIPAAFGTGITALALVGTVIFMLFWRDLLNGFFGSFL
jgi:hypothetical protein